MSKNFFQQYFPSVEFVTCPSRAKKFIEIINDQKLFLELGVGWGANIQNFQEAGWGGEIIGCDLWKRFEQPTHLKDVELVKGDVRDTLPQVLTTIADIKLLSIDLDGDIDATMSSLDQCKPFFKDSFLYIDEFYGFQNWETGLANSVATWLAINVESFDIPFYTENGIALKIDGKYPGDQLMLSLLEYTTEHLYV
jgi:hypothetical protein